MWSYNYSYPTELYHYGVLGMKWGHRKDREHYSLKQRRDNNKQYREMDKYYKDRYDVYKVSEQEKLRKRANKYGITRKDVNDAGIRVSEKAKKDVISKYGKKKIEEIIKFRKWQDTNTQQNRKKIIAGAIAVASVSAIGIGVGLKQQNININSEKITEAALRALKTNFTW